jgi:hypothetical protein
VEVFVNDRPILLVLRLIHVIGGLLCVGAAVTLVAFVLPAARNSGTSIRYVRQLILGERVEAAGANADPDLLAAMDRAQTRYARTMRLVAGMLLGTAAAMAVARYVG